MADVPPPPPGEMTVSPLFGWEAVAGVVLLVLALALVVALVAALRGGRADRPELEALLQARSERRHGPTT
ncbi:hypothetical protein [Blastococcus sp. TF02A-26]|uniref:hypothetical protein n=1 Tax=Blastococcus sp. TF02A-26 TaxID=2250577 RepID=UPI000DE81DCA|nr:hypothetical protein [Blastococcus sp. TF02A-26]RBY83360.1 hypothetical protein DQ240_16870 [Blastococcus sp. TF02A-26]